MTMGGGLTEDSIRQDVNACTVERYRLSDRRNPAVARQFYSEVQAAQSLNHAGVLAPSAIEQSAGDHLVSHERFPGVNAETLIEQLERGSGGMTLSQVLRMCLEAATALASAHERGLIHRQLTPDRVLLGSDGRVRIYGLGLGLAYRCDREVMLGEHLRRCGYCAPEQLSGKTTGTPASDVFQLGVLLYELSTRCRLFQRRTTSRTEEAMHAGIIPAPTALDPTYPLALESVVLRALARQPGRRYADATALAAALREVAGSLALELPSEGMARVSLVAQSEVLTPRNAQASLPPADEPLVGREALMSRLEAWPYSGERSLALVGPSGAGKTRLALEVAHAMANDLLGDSDDIWFCDLTSTASIDAALRVIAKTLQLPRASADDARRLGEQLARHGKLLIVLDGVEAVQTDIVAATRDWLTAVPGLRVIVTSQRAVELEGSTLSVGALAKHAAVELFIRVASEVLGGWRPNARESAAVQHIVGEVDRLPGPIRALATALQTSSIAGLLAELTERVGARGLDEIGGALDRIWPILSPRAQSFLAQASVFEGEFTMAELGPIVRLPRGSGSQDSRDVLTDLHRRALLRIARPDGQTTVFRLYRVAREHARSRLGTSTMAQEVLARHAYWYLRLALGPELLGTQWDRWQADVAGAGRNLRAIFLRAIGTTVPDPIKANIALRVAAALGGVPRFRRAWAMLDTSLALRELIDVDADAAAKALLTRATLRVDADRDQEAITDMREAALLARWAGSDRLVDRAHALQGEMLARDGKPAEARRCLAEVIAQTESQDAWVHRAIRVLEQLAVPPSRLPAWYRRPTTQQT